MDCLYCERPPVIANGLVKVFFDKYPANEGHLLVVPKPHAVIYFDCTVPETQAIAELLGKGKKCLIEHYQPDGNKIGANCSLAVGQTIFHFFSLDFAV